MENKRNLILIVALLLAIVAGGSFISYTNYLDDRLPVIVASRDIEAGTVITSSMLTTAQIHPDAIVKDTFTSSQELLGKEVTTFIGKGEQIVAHRLSEYEKKGEKTVAENLPPDKVAIGVPTSLVNSVGGQIKPNNKVIVYGIDTQLSTAVEIAKDIPVIKILSKAGNEIGVPALNNNSRSNNSNEEPVVVVVEVEEHIAEMITSYMASGQIVFAVQSDQR